jgi:hypothetical protein
MVGITLVFAGPGRKTNFSFGSFSLSEHGVKVKPGGEVADVGKS